MRSARRRAPPRSVSRRSPNPARETAGQARELPKLALDKALQQLALGDGQPCRVGAGAIPLTRPLGDLTPQLPGRLHQRLDLGRQRSQHRQHVVEGGGVAAGLDLAGDDGAAHGDGASRHHPGMAHEAPDPHLAPGLHLEALQHVAPDVYVSREADVAGPHVGVALHLVDRQDRQRLPRQVGTAGLGGDDLGAVVGEATSLARLERDRASAGYGHGTASDVHARHPLLRGLDARQHGSGLHPGDRPPVEQVDALRLRVQHRRLALLETDGEAPVTGRHRRLPLGHQDGGRGWIRHRLLEGLSLDAETHLGLLEGLGDALQHGKGGRHLLEQPGLDAQSHAGRRIHQLEAPAWRALHGQVGLHRVVGDPDDQRQAGRDRVGLGHDRVGRLHQPRALEQGTVDPDLDVPPRLHDGARSVGIAGDHLHPASSDR